MLGIVEVQPARDRHARVNGLAREEIPVLAMLAADEAELRDRAERLAAAIHGATIVQMPSIGATHVRPCVRPKAEANPTARSATVMPTNTLVMVSAEWSVKPTTHGDIAR
jgi:hypothetical protein